MEQKYKLCGTSIQFESIKMHFFCVACILITVKCQCYVYVHTQREATHNVKDEVIDYVQYTEDRGWGKSNLLLFLTLHLSLAPRYPSIFQKIGRLQLFTFWLFSTDLANQDIVCIGQNWHLYAGMMRMSLQTKTPMIRITSPIG